jgi:hypothetical protein
MAAVTILLCYLCKYKVKEDFMTSLCSVGFRLDQALSQTKRGDPLTKKWNHMDGLTLLESL